MVPNVEIWLALISTIGGIVGTYLTVKYKNTRTANRGRTPSEREATLYDGYERLIKQIEGNLVSVKADLDESERANAQLRDKLETVETTVAQLRDRLSNETTRNNQLRSENTRLVNLLQAHNIDITQLHGQTE